MQKKQIKAKQPKTGRPERRIQHEKKPLMTKQSPPALDKQATPKVK